MTDFDVRKWKELGVVDKTKLSVAALLIVSSILLGFVSFFLLLEIPTSVIGLDGLWCSTALAMFGITSYFHNELTKFQSDVKQRLERMDQKNIEDEDK